MEMPFEYTISNISMEGHFAVQGFFQMLCKALCCFAFLAIKVDLIFDKVGFQFVLEPVWLKVISLVIIGYVDYWPARGVHESVLDVVNFMEVKLEAFNLISVQLKNNL